MGVNKLSAYTMKEIEARFLGLAPDQNEKFKVETPHHHISKHQMKKAKLQATAKDWVILHGINNVKDQGNCGSCWAFATTANVEQTITIKTNIQPPALSNQELLSCSYHVIGFFNYLGC